MAWAQCSRKRLNRFLKHSRPKIYSTRKRGGERAAKSGHIRSRTTACVRFRPYR